MRKLYEEYCRQLAVLEKRAKKLEKTESPFHQSRRLQILEAEILEIYLLLHEMKGYLDRETE